MSIAGEWDSYIYSLSVKPYLRNRELGKYRSTAISAVTSLASTFSSNSQESNAPTRIANALEFLETLISIERSKEARFLVMLKEGPLKTLPDEKRQELINSYVSTNQWKGFMTELQKYIGEQRHTLDNIENLNSQLENKVNLLNKDSKLTASKINDFLKHSFEPGELTDILEQAIRAHVTEETLTNWEDMGQLTKRIQAIAFSAIVQWAQNKKELMRDDFNRELDKYINADIAAYDAILDAGRLDDEIEKQTKKAIKDKQIADDHKDNGYLQGVAARSEKAKENLIQLRNSGLRNAEPKLSALRSSLGMMEAQFDHNNQYYLAEVMGAVEQAIHATFAGGRQLGKEGAKPDVLIGHIQIKCSDAADACQSYVYEQYNQAMTQFLDAYSKDMSSINTIAYYKQRATTIRNALNAASQLNNNTNINDWFVIEESTKSYEGVQAGNSGSFGGGSLGPNLKDQLSKISTMITALDKGTAATAGLEKEINSTSQQFAWFLANTINGLIASPYKDSLLLYLAAFVTIFLFDDQVLIWEDALKQQFSKIAPSDNHRLHLFALNQEYYPFSFILQAVHDRIAQKFNQNVNDQLAKSGAKIYIEGAPSIKFNDLYAANKAKEIANSIKLKVEFLNDFQGLINALYG